MDNQRRITHGDVLKEAFGPVFWPAVEYVGWTVFSWLLERHIHWYGWVIGCFVITVGLTLRGAVRCCRNLENIYGTQLADARADRERAMAKAAEKAQAKEVERLAAKVDELLMEKAKNSGSTLLFQPHWIAEQINAPEKDVLKALRWLRSNGKIQSDPSEAGWTVPMIRRILD